jgi:hypothetical protein
MTASREPLPPHRDEEFRRPRGPTAAYDPTLPIEAYQRLVANPFLGLLGFLLWIFALRWLGYELGPALPWPLHMAVFAAGGLILLLFQYHCLDCGASGSLFRWHRHECEAVLERRRDGRPCRVRMSFTLQFMLWVFFLVLLVTALRAGGWLEWR